MVHVSNQGAVTITHATSVTGTKFDQNKVPMDLLSHKALEEIANVFGFGAKKYARFNYRKGLDYSRIIASAYRHLGAFNSGEDLDPESGLPHLGHLGCCVVMLLDMVREHPELDDRYKSLSPIEEQKQTQGPKPPESIY